MSAAFIEGLDRQLVGRLAETLQISDETAQAATEDAVAALVAALAQLASLPGGSTTIDELLELEPGSPHEVPARLLDSGDSAAGTSAAAAVLGSSEAHLAGYLARKHSLSQRQAQRLLRLLAPPTIALAADERARSGAAAAALAARLIEERDRRASGALTLPAATQPGNVGALPLSADDGAATTEDDDRRGVLAALWRKKIVRPVAALFALLGVVLALLLGELAGGSEATVEPPPPAPAAAPAPGPVAAPPPPPAPEPEPVPEPVTLLDRAVERGSFSTFLAAADAAGLGDALSSDEPITVFAPSDAALAGIGLEAGDERLQAVLAAHIVDGRLSSADLAQNSTVTSRDGTQLDITVTGDSIAVGTANVIEPDLEADNGVLHGMDGLVLPPQRRTLIEVATDDGRFGTLLAALEQAGLAEVLAGEEVFTLFAPTDEAFAELPEGALEALLTDSQTLDEVVGAHVAGGTIDAAEIAGRAELISATGQRLAITVEGDTVAVGGATITESDIAADNGLIHVVDAVIVPEGVTIGAPASSLIDLLADSDNLTVFFGALAAAGLLDQLGSEEPFTLFAPTDDAWDRLPGDALQQILTDPEQLTAALSAHIAGGVIDGAEVVARETITMSSGEEVAVVTAGGRTWIGGAALTETGLEADNGLIHTIDRVILPASAGVIAGTVNELLALSPVNFEVASAEIAADGRRVPEPCGRVPADEPAPGRGRRPHGLRRRRGRQPDTQRETRAGGRRSPRGTGRRPRASGRSGLRRDAGGGDKRHRAGQGEEPSHRVYHSGQLSRGRAWLADSARLILLPDPAARPTESAARRSPAPRGVCAHARNPRPGRG